LTTLTATPLEHRFSVDGITLFGHLARPSGSRGSRPGVVVCHGFPSGHGGGPKSAHTYPQLADRIAEDVDAVVLAFNFRGCQPSEGMFSMAGWRNDLAAAVGHLAGQPGVDGIALVGFGTGGALAICAGADDDRVQSVAALGAPGLRRLGERAAPVARSSPGARHPRRQGAAVLRPVGPRPQ
jgi:putative redox protein